MKTLRATLGFLSALAGLALAAQPAPTAPPGEPPVKTVRLADVRLRDACILPVAETQTYYLVASSRGAAVQAYTSKDLVNWEGPHLIFKTPPGWWGGAHVRSIWAPELHAHQGKYYLFLTFDTTDKFPEQWRNWLPRVKRGSQVLWSDAALGPYHAFADQPTPPADMMTLDGTLWVEDGVPYMVFSHEWVQIVDGTMEMLRLTDDLSAAVGEPTRLFFASDAPWSKQSKQYGCWVTDGPYIHRSTSGKLFMIWSSGGEHGYTTGVAVSDSGKLAGPWRQQAEPLYGNDGGHGMIFRTFAGRLMLTLHQPNESPRERIHLFELEDTGETLRIVQEFGGAP